ncbi:hypothetical protein GGF32_004604 [Allomyces javanicus]|nr:hypothetical protein GGF32_004604 [Allomyces javanicus]
MALEDRVFLPTAYRTLDVTPFVVNSDRNLIRALRHYEKKYACAFRPNGRGIDVFAVSAAHTARASEALSTFLSGLGMALAHVFKVPCEYIRHADVDSTLTAFKGAVKHAFPKPLVEIMIAQPGDDDRDALSTVIWTKALCGETDKHHVAARAQVELTALLADLARDLQDTVATLEPRKRRTLVGIPNKYVEDVCDAEGLVGVVGAAYGQPVPVVRAMGTLQITITVTRVHPDA